MMDHLQENQVGASQSAEERSAIAPWWHTTILLVLLAVWAVMSHGRSSADRSSHHIELYLSSAMMSWMLLGSVVAGIYCRRDFFRNAFERNQLSWSFEVMRGFGIYATVFVMFGLVQGALYLTHFRSSFDRTVVEAMAPRTALEMLAWTALSVSAGICEELVFRGYLLQQSIGWIRRCVQSPVTAQGIAAVATSVLFGSLHLYEGGGGALLITLLGFAYAIIALRIGNLRAVIIAHILQDLLAGVLLFALHLHKG